MFLMESMCRSRHSHQPYIRRGDHTPPCSSYRLLIRLHDLDLSRSILGLVDHNILEVTAVSAIALTAPSREKLLAKLQKMTGKNIVLTETVDPAVLGGLRLDMGGTRLDGTVQRHLERLRTEIDGAVL